MTRSRPRRFRWAALIMVGVVIVLFGVVRSFSHSNMNSAGGEDQAPSRRPTATTASAGSGGPTTPTATRPACATRSGKAKPPTTVQQAFAEIPICAADTGVDYRRSAFGPAWTDDNTTTWGDNGCRTRDDLLRRDLVDQHFTADDHCRPASGVLPDPYTGKKISYQKGPSVQADHVVSLGRSWQTGARFLSESQRINLANDPLNLLMVDGHTNESKSDDVGWLPPNRSFDCRYLALQIAVISKYQLWHTPSEHRTIAAQLSSCPTMTLAAEPGGRGDK